MTFTFYEDGEKIIEKNNKDDFIKELKKLYKGEFVDWITEVRHELIEVDFCSYLEDFIERYEKTDIDLFDLLEEIKSYCGMYWYEITSD